MNRYLSTFLMLTIVLFLCAGQAAAQSGTEYPNGAEGIKAGSIPPPALYLRYYNYFYGTSTLKDPNGNPVNAGLDVFAYAMAPRLIWVTKAKVLGGDYFNDIVLPFIYQDFKVGHGSSVTQANHFYLGDITLEPVGIAWHGPHWDQAIALAVYLPTGKYSTTQPGYPGKGYYTGQFTYGVTYYLDNGKTWSIAYLPRYEVHGTQRGHDVKLGDDFHHEFSIAKAAPEDRRVGPFQAFAVGMVGYTLWQVTDAQGKDVIWDKSVHDRVFALGPEIRFAVPKMKVGVEFRTNFEFAAVNRPQGIAGVFNFTRAF